MSWSYYFIETNCLSLCQGAADAVLEAAGVGGMEHTLIHYREGELMAFGRGSVACESDHSLERAGLGVDVILRLSAPHAASECAVLAGHGERGIEMTVDIGTLAGIEQRLHQQFGRSIVVERDAAAVGYDIARRIEAEAVGHGADLRGGGRNSPSSGSRATRTA